MKTMMAKQFLTSALLILLSFLVLGTSFITLSSQFLADQREGELKNNADLVAAAASLYLAEGSFQFPFEFHMAVSTIATVANTHIMLCDPRGEVVITSDPPNTIFTGYTVPTEVLDAVALSAYYYGTTTLGGLYDTSYYTVAVPVIDKTSGSLVGIAMVSTSAVGQRELLASFFRIFCLSGMFVLLVTYMSNYAATRRMTRPLKLMAAAAREFAHGNFNTHIEVRAGSRDEVSELATAFNAMVDSLRQSEELRRSFIADVSHELRTPMTTIGGYIDGNLDGTIPPERQEDCLKIISSEVRRLTRLVHRMLDVTRMQSGEMQLNIAPFDLYESIRQVVANLERRISARGLDVALPDGDDGGEESVLMVRGDRDAVMQVLYNLIDNAAKYAYEQTVITITAARSGPLVTVTVENDGHDIPQEDASRIFERFHKVDRSRGQDRESIGLGLYIVRTIIHAHGQDVSVQSEGGHITFAFTLEAAGKKDIPNPPQR